MDDPRLRFGVAMLLGASGEYPPPPTYLSPRFTNIDPDGFNTRRHSAVTAHNASRNACGVASDPIWPS